MLRREYLIRLRTDMHSTPTTTLNIYSHCFEENKTKSVDIVNTALGGFI